MPGVLDVLVTWGSRFPIGESTIWEFCWIVLDFLRSSQIQGLLDTSWYILIPPKSEVSAWRHLGTPFQPDAGLATDHSAPEPCGHLRREGGGIRASGLDKPPLRKLCDRRGPLNRDNSLWYKDGAQNLFWKALDNLLVFVCFWSLNFRYSRAFGQLFGHDQSNSIQFSEPI